MDPDPPDERSKRRRSATTERHNSPVDVASERPARRPRSAGPLSDEERNRQERLRYQERKAKMTPEQRKAQTKRNTQTQAKKRANETPEQQKIRNQKNAQSTAKSRAKETPEQHQTRNKQDAQAKATSRANEST